MLTVHWPQQFSNNAKSFPLATVRRREHVTAARFPIGVGASTAVVDVVTTDWTFDISLIFKSNNP